jgi:hypothetical protein
MERTSPNYNDQSFNKPGSDKWEKYDRGFDKAINAANTVYGAGRKIMYVFMGLFFFLLGGSLLVWGIFDYTGRVKELDSYEKTTGTVVELREVPETDNSSITYKPVYVFKDAGGKEYRHESNHSSDPPAYKVGEKIEVFYDKNDPGKAFENSFLSKWGGSIILFTVPVVLFPVGLWMLISPFRRRKVPAVQNHAPNESTYVNFG